MSDIFISYARLDRPRAKTLAEALDARGWSVWWDPKIPPGKTWADVIEAALKKTKCVVVLWSERAVKSKWVKREAAEGDRRNILIPATIEDAVEIPLAFRDIQASRLTDWKGETSGHEEFEALIRAIADLVGEPPDRCGKQPEREGPQGGKRTKTPGDVRKVAPRETWVDPKTGLMWTIEDNGKNISWNGAMQYAKELRLGGFTDWRLPTINELEKLYDPKRGRRLFNIREPFRLSRWWVWSSTMVGPGSAWGFGFYYGGRGRSRVDGSQGGRRALCVRRSGE